MRKLICMITVVLLLPLAAMAQSISGQPYKTFVAYYEANIAFINQNANRHMLPLAIASDKSEAGDGRMHYRIFGDVLSMEARTDPTGEILEMCQIMIVAPSGMEVGNAIYNDFTISGYHSYALLMAMDTAADPAQRYQLVNVVEEGLKQAQGSFQTQTGIYMLTCTNANGTVTLTFENTMAAPMPTDNGEAAPDGATGAQPEETPVPEPEDEGAGLG